MLSWVRIPQGCSARALGSNSPCTPWRGNTGPAGLPLKTERLGTPRLVESGSVPSVGLRVTTVTPMWAGYGHGFPTQNLKKKKLRERDAS